MDWDENVGRVGFIEVVEVSPCSLVKSNVEADEGEVCRSTNEDVKESTTLRRKVSVLWVDGDGRGNRAFLRGGAGAVERSRDV